MLPVKDELRHYVASVDADLDVVTKSYIDTIVRRLSENEADALLALLQAAEDAGKATP